MGIQTYIHNFIYNQRKVRPSLRQLLQTPKCPAAMLHFRLTARCKWDRFSGMLRTVSWWLPTVHAPGPVYLQATLFPSSPSRHRVHHTSLTRLASVAFSENQSPPTYLQTYIHTYILTYLLTYLLTPWSRVRYEKLKGSRLVKKFPTFYGIQRIITTFTGARQLSLPRATSIKSISPHPTSWRSILILSSHLRLGLPNVLFPSDFPTKSLYTPLLSPKRATWYIPSPSHPTRFDHPINIVWRVQIIKLLIM